MNILQKLPSLSRKQRKIALVTVGGIILLVLIGVGVGLSVRGKVLNKAMKRAEAVLLDRYNIDFKVRDVRFTGLATVTFRISRCFREIVIRSPGSKKWRCRSASGRCFSEM